VMVRLSAMARLARTAAARLRRDREAMGTTLCHRLSGPAPVRVGISLGDAVASLYGVIGA